jgi:HAD superfamily hydrolase (TIGR01509 family)
VIKAIFWDNDGILVETEQFYFQAMQETLGEVGIDLSLAEFIRIALDEGKSCLELAAQRGLDAATMAILRERKDQRYAKLLASGIAPRPGVRRALTELHTKVRMAVVTSSQRHHFELIHRRNGLLDLFDFILTREDFVLTKPHPEPYLKALDRSGLAAGECLVIEDTVRGLQSALNAGLRCIVVPSSLAPEKEFPGAWRVLPDLDAVTDFLLAEPGLTAWPESARPTP